MAKVTIPGLKASTGMKAFSPLAAGRYKLKVTEIKQEESANSPCDIIKFTMDVVKGPEQEDGSSAKGKKYFANVVILRDIHPSFEKYGHIGVDELKSMCLAFGVAPKGDSIDIDAFLGMEAEADITQKLEDNGKGEDVKRNRASKWVEASAK